jgi:hypothetical protein
MKLTPGGKKEGVQHQSTPFLNNAEKGFYDKSNLLHRNQSELVGSDTLPSFPTQERCQFHQLFTSRYFLAFLTLYRLCFVIFREKIATKAAHKMLVKLISGEVRFIANQTVPYPSIDLFFRAKARQKQSKLGILPMVVKYCPTMEKIEL